MPVSPCRYIRIPALILGMEGLRLFNRVAIDFQSQRVLFDLPQGDGWQNLREGDVISAVAEP